jgi:hypothetical protein
MNTANLPRNVTVMLQKLRQKSCSKFLREMARAWGDVAEEL